MYFHRTSIGASNALPSSLMKTMVPLLRTIGYRWCYSRRPGSKGMRFLAWDPRAHGTTVAGLKLAEVIVEGLFVGLAGVGGRDAPLRDKARFVFRSERLSMCAHIKRPCPRSRSRFRPNCTER